MTDNGLLYKIGITCIKGIGPMLAKNLIAYTGSPENIFKEKRGVLERIPGIGTVLAEEIVKQRDEALKRASQELEFIDRQGIRTCYFTDKDYPYRLKECADAPLVLFGKGMPDLNAARFIAVVGTRKATDEGRENCRRLIEGIARALPGAVIVSGLAYGIDVCAHKAALEFGLPTVAVLAHGLDMIYPALHRSVAGNILAHGGGLLTEYMSATRPDKPNFVQRNRIVAGMCDTLVVVESARKGGALITAHLACDYNRDVFAFPGRVTDETSAGCHELIKRNLAALIESADDLLDAMNWLPKDKNAAEHPLQQTLFDACPEEEDDFLRMLRTHPDGLSANELVALTMQPFSQVSSRLLEMELNGLVKRMPGNVYKMKK